MLLRSALHNARDRLRASPSASAAAGAAAVSAGLGAIAFSVPGAAALAGVCLGSATLATALAALQAGKVEPPIPLDELTGLPSRRWFVAEIDRRLAQARASGGGVTAMTVDLRRFRDINEHLGHEVGDALLLAVRSRLRDAISATASFARIGGDEFGVVFSNATQSVCERRAARICEAMREPLQGPAGRAAIRIAIGYATVDADERDAVDAHELLRRAEVAVTLSKRREAGAVAYSAELSEEMARNKRLEADLRAALDAGELHVYYQPIYDIDGATMVGAEALARWRHRDLGWISPQDFVTLAEERGLISQLGEFVLRTACLEARGWPKHLFVAVNVSPAQFLRDSFLADVSRILEETGLPPHRLELELTETAVVSDEAKAEDTIIELRARGVRMALDDFGAGYSSLIYLRRFAFDKIKIDRSFLEALEPSGESAIIVESMVHLGRSLGLTVTAEGIETPEQHRFLQAIGCHELQGFLFSRALPAPDFLVAASMPAALPKSRRVARDVA
jgi:diguanylate cyclase (GGDEF)-like protein